RRGGSVIVKQFRTAPPAPKRSAMSDELAAQPDKLTADRTSEPGVALLTGERQMVWTIWLSYGAFYFCRTNLSAAVPGMEDSVGEGGLGLKSEEVGAILASLKIAYGVGQLLNGQLSERVSPRVLLAVGMFGSALLNMLFGL